VREWGGGGERVEVAGRGLRVVCGVRRGGGEGVEGRREGVVGHCHTATHTGC
jgi:hypothetical protein